MKKVYIDNPFSPGDIVVMTAAIRDLVETYPNEYEILVNSRCNALLEDNPKICCVSKAPENAITIFGNYKKYLRYDLSPGPHFISAYHRLFSEILEINIPLLQPKGELFVPLQRPQILDKYLQNDEKYWVALCGGKTDTTTKIWPAQYWNKLAKILLENGIRLVQTGRAPNRTHLQPSIEHTINLVGYGGLKELCSLIYFSEGVICPITCAMHIAAVYDKRCIVLAGGREPDYWEHYTNFDRVNRFGNKCSKLKTPHIFIHTFGMLDCCLNKACWARYTVASEGSKHTRCSKPVLLGEKEYAPSCLALISPSKVSECVINYDELVTTNINPLLISNFPVVRVRQKRFAKK